MRYHNITKDDMLNGDGLRAVLWVAGCEHHCKGCQNPVTWDPNGGLEFDTAALNELFVILEKPYISGVTFSGGDPLHPNNREEVLRIARMVKELPVPLHSQPKTVWLYTGYLWEEINDIPGIEYVDVIVDGRFVESLADVNHYWAGSTNQRVIDVKKSLEMGCAIKHVTKIEHRLGDFKVACEGD